MRKSGERTKEVTPDETARVSVGVEVEAARSLPSGDRAKMRDDS